MKLNRIQFISVSTYVKWLLLILDFDRNEDSSDFAMSLVKFSDLLRDNLSKLIFFKFGKNYKKFDQKRVNMS